MDAKRRKIASKTLSFRIDSELYNFIESKSKELGITKTDFFFTQIDPNSELASFVKKDLESFEAEIKVLKAEHKEFKQAFEKDLTAMLEESDDKTVIALYKDDHDKQTKKVFERIAKKRGITLQKQN